MFHQNRKPLYRNKSLARLSSPEGLDEMMKVINPKSWLVLVAYISIIVTGIIWSIFGHISITTEAKGQLINLGTIEYVKSPQTGRLQELKVKNGAVVKQNDVLAVIDTGNSKQQEVFSNISGRVLWTAPQGENLNSKHIFAIIEKNGSNFKKSIICLSSSECQKIKSAKKIQITASEMPEDKLNVSLNNLTTQILDDIIQVRDNVEIDAHIKGELDKYSSYPVSIRAIQEYSPISLIFPQPESSNGTK